MPDGSFLTVTRLDGLDEIIMWGTGSHSGHSVVVITIDGIKYVVESQDGWYWPKGDIQRTRYEDWVQFAENADMHVAVLPLNEKYAKKWDNDKAAEWFKTMEGYPYGYHNFLLSWIDTVNDNLPPLMPRELLPIAFDIIDHIQPKIFNNMMGESLNKRLGTEGLNMREIMAEAAQVDKTVMDLLAEPELDEYVYSDGPSQVCSCFVAGIYKAGGLFGDMEVQATEFSPKDVYQMKIYEQDLSLIHI